MESVESIHRTTPGHCETIFHFLSLVSCVKSLISCLFASISRPLSQVSYRSFLIPRLLSHLLSLASVSCPLSLVSFLSFLIPRLLTHLLSPIFPLLSLCPLFPCPCFKSPFIQNDNGTEVNDAKTQMHPWRLRKTQRIYNPHRILSNLPSSFIPTTFTLESRKKNYSALSAVR